MPVIYNADPHTSDAIHLFQKQSRIRAPLPGMSSMAIRKGRLTLLCFIWILNMLLRSVQMSLASKPSSMVVLHPCAMLNLFVLQHIFKGKTNRHYRLCVSSHHKNNTCASGDSHQLWLTITLAAPLGFMSANILFATKVGGVRASFSFLDCAYMDWNKPLMPFDIPQFGGGGGVLAANISAYVKENCTIQDLHEHQGPLALVAAEGNNRCLFLSSIAYVFLRMIDEHPGLVTDRHRVKYICFNMREINRATLIVGGMEELRKLYAGRKALTQQFWFRLGMIKSFKNDSSGCGCMFPSHIALSKWTAIARRGQEWLHINCITQNSG